MKYLVQLIDIMKLCSFAFEQVDFIPRTVKGYDEFLKKFVNRSELSMYLGSNTNNELLISGNISQNVSKCNSFQDEMNT